MIVQFVCATCGAVQDVPNGTVLQPSTMLNCIRCERVTVVGLYTPEEANRLPDLVGAGLENVYNRVGEG